MCSVQFSHSVVSDSLRPHEPQHARPPCPSPTPGVHPNPCPLSQWCHPTISSSVLPFCSCPQSFPASGSFQMSQLFASGSQSIEVSMNIQESCELSFIWGKVKTAAWETAPQRVLRKCSREIVGEGQYTRFWWRGSSMQSSTYFTRGFLLISRNWVFWISRRSN